MFQQAMFRLHRALSEVKPESVRHFFNLAAVMIRRTLLDLAKHHLGPHGQGTKHHTDGQPADDEGGAIHDRAEQPEDLEAWSAFHAQVEALPDEEKEVVESPVLRGADPGGSGQRLGHLASHGQAALAFGPLSPAPTVEPTGAGLMTDDELVADLLLRWEETA